MLYGNGYFDLHIFGVFREEVHGRLTLTREKKTAVSSGIERILFFFFFSCFLLFFRVFF